MIAIIYNLEDAGEFTHGYEIQCDNYVLAGTAESFEVAVAMAKEDGANVILDHCE